MSWRRFRWGLLAWAAWAVAGAAAEESAAAPERPWTEVRQESFDLVWRTVNEAYFDRKFGGVDWGAVRERYAARLDEAEDKPALRALLQRMLGELHRSHFAILPREAAVFTPKERDRIGKAGADIAWTEGAVVVTNVEREGPAEKAGLKHGDVLRAVGGQNLADLAAKVQRNSGWDAERAGRYVAQWAAHQLCGPVGKSMGVEVDRGQEEARAVELAPESHDGAWSEPIGSFPSWPVAVRQRMEPDGVGYVAFNTFARETFREVRDFVLKLPADGALVIDLRGNPGGLSAMAAGLTGWLTDHPLWLGQMQLRQGVMQFTAFPQEGAFLGPVAVLIDGASASTSEILAAGLQGAGRARIFGERSAGQALPSSFVRLPMGDLFQFAMADIVTARGVSLEGTGVTPDEPVQRTRAEVAAGRDAVLEAARAWLQGERGRSARPAAPSPTNSSPP